MWIQSQDYLTKNFLSLIKREYKIQNDNMQLGILLTIQIFMVKKGFYLHNTDVIVNGY